MLYWIENSGQNSHDQNLALRIFPNLVQSAKKKFRAECDCAHEKVPKHSLARSAIVYAHSVFFKNSYNSKIYYNFRRYLAGFSFNFDIFSRPRKKVSPLFHCCSVQNLTPSQPPSIRRSEIWLQGAFDTPNLAPRVPSAPSNLAPRFFSKF